MNIKEFTEKYLGCTLSLWQKEILQKIAELPPGSKLVYCNGKLHIIGNDGVR